jgi:hypothetical protein
MFLTHILARSGKELRALRQIQRNYPDTPYVFVSERRSPLRPSVYVKSFLGQH